MPSSGGPLGLHWPLTCATAVARAPVCRRVLQMIATRNIAMGEELVNNYGELSNAELLRAYGEPRGVWRS
jgi:hypothetical protein